MPVAITILVLLLLAGGNAFVRLLFSAQRAAPKDISFRQQFRPGAPRPGWRYLWNATEIGQTNGYRALVWNGRSYGFDDDPDFPRPGPAGWVNIARTAGHPGPGKGPGRHFDTYAIIGFTVTNAGSYLITNSFIMRDDGDFRGDINLRVFVNEQPIGPELVANKKEPLSFDRSLGMLQRGDTLYVAIGPNGSDNNDHFVLDFSIVSPEP